jgi:hypothetical protein
MIRITSTILIRGINPYLPISAARAARLKPGWRKPMPVRVRINGKPRAGWRINMMPRGDGGFYLYLHGQIRKASATQVGDRVTAEVWFDAKYRGGPAHPMPASFKAALSRAPQAKRAWASLIPSRQKEILRYLAALKSPEAQARNIERALKVLSGEPSRFMARSWTDGK